METPLHGFQGDRTPLPPAEAGPRELTIAVSRESGARGGSIAKRVGRELGWQVYHQELLDYIVQEDATKESILGALNPAELQWVEERLQQSSLAGQTEARDQAKLILALGVPGEVVLLGRGAGCLLPPETTLHVRIVAPREDRIAYMGQWLRLTVTEAAEQVNLRDRRRSDLIQKQYHRLPGDLYQYDLLLNSSLLGEDLCVDLIVRAAKAKQEARHGAPDNLHSWETEVAG